MNNKFKTPIAMLARTDNLEVVGEIVQSYEELRELYKKLVDCALLSKIDRTKAERNIEGCEIVIAAANERVNHIIGAEVQLKGEWEEKGSIIDTKA